MYNQTQLKEVVDRALIILSYNNEAPRLIDPVKYVLSKGGKRLRPVMSLMACNIFTDMIDEAVLPAIGIEVFHNFTLVHDDIMDKAPMRRGSPTVHTRWNESQAILSGDVMAFIANDCLLQAPPGSLLKVFRIFNKAAVEVCVGQQMDMDFERAAIVKECEYLRMIELKTSVLLAAAVKIGSIIGGADDKNADLMFEFGRNLGLAFQIQDDMLDIWGDVKVFGKSAGGDIVSNKKTFPLVKAMEIAKGNDLKTLKKLFSAKDTDPETKIRKVVAILDEMNIKDTTEILAHDYVNKALGFLQKVNVDDARKEELTNLAISLIGRKR